MYQLCTKVVQIKKESKDKSKFNYNCNSLIFLKANLNRKLRYVVTKNTSYMICHF